MRLASLTWMILSLLLNAAIPVAGQESGGDDPFGNGSTDPFQSTAKKVQLKAKKQVVTPNPPSPGEEMIRKVLGNKTTFSALELPLSEVVQDLSKQHKIPILIDRRALEEFGLSADEPVTLTLENVSLRSYLKLLLRDLDLTYMVMQEVLQITTIQAAEQNLILQAYQIPDLFVDNSEQLIRAVTATVTPAQWENLGGPCTAVVVDNVLLVSATETGHEGVLEFMEKLRSASEKKE